MKEVFMTYKLPDAAVAKIEQHFSVAVGTEDRHLTKEEIIDGAKGKQALVTLLSDNVDREVIEALPQLEVIANYAVGTNNIDIAGATEKKVKVTNTPGVLTDATADLTWALILAVTRRIPEGDRMMRDGQFTGWAPELLLGSELNGKTLGIIGFGRIGMAVAKRAAGFNMPVIYHSRRQKSPVIEGELKASYRSMEGLLAEADLVTLHLPLTEQSHYFIDEAVFKRMKDSAYLINTARGPIVKEEALVSALENGEIAGAALDVYEHEPLVHQRLIGMNNVVLAPHTGSATVETRNRMAEMVADNVIAALNGDTPPNWVNPF